MVTLSVAIMAHPSRALMVASILKKLDRPNVKVIWDQKRSRWDTGRRSMLAYDPKCTHHLVLQDDILVCRDLIEGYRQALEHTPGDVALCGYVGRVRPNKKQVLMVVQRANAMRASFIRLHTLSWGPAIAVPTEIIPEMIAYCDPLRDVPNYDRRLSRYWEQKRQLLVWYTWPNLVDHADGPSLVPGRIGTNRAARAVSRVAHNFIGEDRSALEVNWGGPVASEDPVASLHLAGLGGLVTYQHAITGNRLTFPANSQRARRYRGLHHWKIVGGE